MWEVSPSLIPRYWVKLQSNGNKNSLMLAQNRHVNQRNRLEAPDISQCSCITSSKVSKVTKGGAALSHTVLGQYTYRGNKIGLSSLPLLKIQLHMDQRPWHKNSETDRRKNTEVTTKHGNKCIPSAEDSIAQEIRPIVTDRAP